MSTNVHFHKELLYTRIPFLLNNTLLLFYSVLDDPIALSIVNAYSIIKIIMKDSKYSYSVGRFPLTYRIMYPFSLP